MSKRNNEPVGFEPIWQAIKGWDIQRATDEGYHGPTGDDVRTILTALAAAGIAMKLDGWHATHVHLRTNGMYRQLMRGHLEADLTPVVIYDNSEGRVWVRPAAEFDDGRFMELPPFMAVPRVPLA